jgi:hypothetical protein
MNADKTIFPIGVYRRLMECPLALRQPKVSRFLGYLSREEFERPQKPGAKWSPAALSFLRHEEIYSDV